MAPLTLENLAKNVKTSLLFHEHLVLDIPLPASELARLPGAASNDRESTFIRWSAINCGPTEFTRKNYYILRPLLYNKPRQTKLLISVNISDTDNETTIRNTLDCILRNVNFVKTATDLNSIVSWKEIVVVFIGSSSVMRPETSDFLRRLGLFTKPVPFPLLDKWTGQIYEYTPFLSPRSIGKEPRPLRAPYQLIFFDSGTRLTTDMANIWIVRAFATLLKAEIWVSIEPGKKLKNTAFVTILQEFQKIPSCLSIVGYTAGFFRRSSAADPTVSVLAFSINKQLKQSVESIKKNIGNAVRAYKLKLLLSSDYELVES
ncbi:hypothetical protein B0O99DRAFT_744822 [Bisporella sp. PMI_857]|nr:hypothetical protein B0O99DRAFT_744822 [Bisporella sp. PMI_857]